MGDLGLIPELGTFPGEGKGYPLQYSGLENSMHSPWGRKDLDVTEQHFLTSSFNLRSSLFQGYSVEPSVPFRILGFFSQKYPLVASKGISFCSSDCNAGDLGSIPGSGKCSGEGNGNPLGYSCLENSMDGGIW